MSLLLDALKRAEEAKRAKEGIEGDESGAAKPAAPVVTEFPELSLEDYSETIPPKSPPREPVFADAEVPPGMALALEEAPAGPDTMQTPAVLTPSVEAPKEMAMPAARKPPAGPSAEESIHREAIRNAFAVKQPSSVSRGKWLLPLIAFAVVGVGAGGWYVWSEINRGSRPTVRPVPPPPPLPQASSSTGQAGGKAGDATAKSGPALPPLLPPPAVEVPLPRAAVAAKTVAPEWTEREVLARSLKDMPKTPESPVKLQLSQSLEEPKVAPGLMAAWEALVKGDYARAKGLYAQVAQADPFNADAHLGLAVAAARSGDNALAARQYRRVLEIDPRNGMAVSGLVAVSGEIKVEILEVELKALIARDPGSAPLQFSLGNLYASERRWTEAQQAYFEAWRLESGNADYLYNLAVSLDQLNQSRLALEYYRKALAQREKTGGQFEPATVRQRIAELNGT